MTYKEERMREIEREIASESSPVGIDAKKTHVLILLKLESIERRLSDIEAGLADNPVRDAD
jgi:hypothetical protein